MTKGLSGGVTSTVGDTDMTTGLTGGVTRTVGDTDMTTGLSGDHKLNEWTSK
jgi:hypothetical protein